MSFGGAPPFTRQGRGFRRLFLMRSVTRKNSLRETRKGIKLKNLVTTRFALSFTLSEIIRIHTASLSLQW